MKFLLPTLSVLHKSLRIFRITFRCPVIRKDILITVSPIAIFVRRCFERLPLAPWGIANQIELALLKFRRR